MTKSWTIVFQLFWTFFKIGPVTFGGGYAMIPLIEKEVVDRRKWIKSEEIVDVFALVESVPGAIAINSATFIGFRIAGIKGALAAMFGILMPTFTIIIILAMIHQILKGNLLVDAAFQSIRASIVALIIYAGIKIGKTAVIDFSTVILTGITVIILFFVKVHPVIIIVSGILLGIIIQQIKTNHNKGNKEHGTS